MLVSFVANSVEAKTAKKSKPKVSQEDKTVDNLEYDINDARSQNTDTRTELELLEHDKVAIVDEIETLRKERAALKAKHAEYLINIKAEKKELTKKTSVVKAQQITNNEEARVINKEVAKLDAENKALKKIAAKEEKALAKTQEALNLAKSKLAAATEKKAGLTDKIAKLEESKKQDLMEIERLSAEMKTTKDEITMLNIKLPPAQSSQASAAARVELLTKDVAILKQENKNYEEKVQKVEEAVTDLQRAIKAGETQLENLRKQNETLLKRGKQALLNKPKLQAKYAQMKKEYKSLMEQNKSLKAKLTSEN